MMLKRMLTLSLALLLLLPGVLAEEKDESGAGILEDMELRDWAEGYLTRARAAEPLNDPHEPEALSEDGYAFVYDFATLWLDSPELTADSVLQAVLITSEEETGPRGTHIDQPAEELLQAFYYENPDLAGDRGFAALYEVDLLPEGAAWAWVQRDGQRLMTVQYAVHDQLASGGEGYTDAGLVYTMQENLVSAIRAYGLNQVLDEESVRANLAEVAQVFTQRDYVYYPQSTQGETLLPLTEDELRALPLLQDTPDAAVKAFGDPVESDWVKDGSNQLRVMDWGDFQLTWVCDSKKKNPVLDSLEIVGGDAEGPRGLRVGDSFTSVHNRFRHGEGQFDPDTFTEQLYGTERDASWGLVEYGQEADAVIRYVCPWGEGGAMLYLTFDQLQLQDITLMLNP